ncbi:hypothetical protein CJU04_10215 [Pseudomonas aeruginosa]|nr:hypothetical protein B0B18_28340 [Pseudomonas aeruginosa]OXT55606.1 hypothetical protein CF343_27840 [Pseudomonas aeruginosa]PBW69023.1 hypothetical protein CJU04_10215 [Pseudomonas aeruginosa]HBP5369965.1 hypothetical protein [Pseudomonas aeruginosa]
MTSVDIVFCSIYELIDQAPSMLVLIVICGFFVNDVPGANFFTVMKNPYFMMVVDVSFLDVVNLSIVCVGWT